MDLTSSCLDISGVSQGQPPGSLGQYAGRRTGRRTSTGAECQTVWDSGVAGDPPPLPTEVFVHCSPRRSSSSPSLPLRWVVQHCNAHSPYLSVYTRGIAWSCYLRRKLLSWTLNFQFHHLSSPTYTFFSNSLFAVWKSWACISWELSRISFLLPRVPKLYNEHISRSWPPPQ